MLHRDGLVAALEHCDTVAHLSARRNGKLSLRACNERVRGAPNQPPVRIYEPEASCSAQPVAPGRPLKDWWVTPMLADGECGGWRGLQTL
jgi:hypothetical protein